MRINILGYTKVYRICTKLHRHAQTETETQKQRECIRRGYMHKGMQKYTKVYKDILKYTRTHLSSLALR